RKWPWQVGLAFGLALATKHTAVLLPFALALHYLFLVGYAKRKISPWFVGSVAVLGPLVLFILWPWLWLDPIGHVRQWLPVPRAPRALQLRVPRRELERAAVPVARRARHDAVHGADGDFGVGGVRHLRVDSPRARPHVPRHLARALGCRVDGAVLLRHDADL